MTTLHQANEASLTGQPPLLVFTDTAATKVGELIREEGNPNLKLRVFVSGGGCSGFQYGFTFDENEEEGDTCVETRGVKQAASRVARRPRCGRPGVEQLPHGGRASFARPARHRRSPA